MTEQLIAPAQHGNRALCGPSTMDAAARSPRPVPRELRAPHAVDVVDHLFALIEHAPDHRVDGSLLDLAIAAGCDLETARHAVASLDPADHVVSADIRRVPAEEHWQLTWAPVSGIVDLMLDWDLHTLDISVAELAEWLGVPVETTGRALDWLATTPGVTVLRAGAGSYATVRVTVVLDRCPLTAEAPPEAG